jgi:hypothetical protein
MRLIWCLLRASRITPCRNSRHRHRAIVGEMQKALVYSSPSSASVLLPAASTSADRDRCSRSQETGASFASQDPPVAKRLFGNGSHVNSGFLHLGCREPAEQLDRRGTTFELGWGAGAGTSCDRIE